jgi:hypothetical protein
MNERKEKGERKMLPCLLAASGLAEGVYFPFRLPRWL